MALHRDIFWIGHQWAVTGAGLQAIDKRFNGAFDVAPKDLWDLLAVEDIRDQSWIKRGDFAEALSAARKHYADLRPVGALLEVEPEPDPAAPQTIDPTLAASSPVSVTSPPVSSTSVQPNWPRTALVHPQARFIGSWRVRFR